MLKEMIEHNLLKNPKRNYACLLSQYLIYPFVYISTDGVIIRHETGTIFIGPSIHPTSYGNIILYKDKIIDEAFIYITNNNKIILYVLTHIFSDKGYFE